MKVVVSLFRKTIKHTLELQYDFGEYINGFTVVDSSIGPMGEICILTVNKVPERIDGAFPPVHTTESHDYRVIILAKGEIKEIVLKNQKWNYHFIQTIDNDNILLVCARAHLYDDGKFDRNAKVFDRNGTLLREFLLGDGIQDLYVTKENNIWTSYFDEGVYGNYGWNEPIGRNGLRAWDSNGNELYKYPNSNAHFIDDCYALNVLTDQEVWFYFYSEFELGRYDNGSIEYYKPDVEGADGFIIYEDYVLFRGGYSNRDKYTLYKMHTGNQLKKVGLLTLLDENRKEIKAESISCRGSLLLLTNGTKVYLSDLKDITNAL